VSLGIPLKLGAADSTLAVLVPDKTVCPRCKKVGFVRYETVVARGQTHRAYYCGACDYSWNIAEDGRKTDSDNPERPDRSRPR